MAAYKRAITAALLLSFIAKMAVAETRCGYMNAIPRPPTPDFPPHDFEGLTWAQQPLLPVEKREEVCMEEHNTSSNMQIIFMEEEIVGDVVLAKLNYNGIEKPYIVSPLMVGMFSMLGPDIRRIPEEDGAWHLVITQRQDFENPSMKSYIFYIRVDDEKISPMVVLDIVNIDDNPPVIELFESCRIPELGEPGQTQCRYRVNDADGQISTSVMRFTIESDRGDEEVFTLFRENVPNEWMWTWMVLHLNKSLDFEENRLHIFGVTAWDSLPNNGTGTMMVEVENVESRPPRWVELFAVQQFDEKTNQTFKIRAIDADTEIRKPIHYRLKTAENDTFFHIESVEDGALFTVDPIDRDTLEREQFHLSIIAYKYGDDDEEGHPSFESPIDVIIIINDVNDQRPVPFQNQPYTIEIREETAMTLNIENFGFHDRDLGQNAQYRVHLESVSPPGAHEAFYIAPEVGYQRQSFIMGTQNHSMLDFEVPDFQHIELRVVAIDMNNESHVGIAPVNIHLLNWNDEEPIFEFSTRTVTFKETVGAGHYVTQMLARDRDIDDAVEHSLLGNAVDYLEIDKETGEIYVSIDNAFDFHRQNELFVQVRAVDTLGEPFHTATAQLVIHLEDVNNTPPTLRLPRGRVEVEENVPDGFPLVVPQDIMATDPDTTANLRFEIDWTSSYATKQGRETPAVEFHNCIEIQTVYPFDNSNGTAIGRVVVKEIKPNVTIDYEEFEVLYVTVRVWDLNTEIGDPFDESTFTITIIDMNDNAPIWAEGSLAQEFRVREVAASGVVIGSVFATDIDGPLYNQVRYTIFPTGETPPDLVDIDFVTGQIAVKKHQAIDADQPKRHHLTYTVIASDECSADDKEDCPPDRHFWEVPGEIVIFIIDTNNKEPVLEKEQFNSIIYMYENATTGDEIVNIISSDLDRDDIYNTLRYTISYGINPRLLDFFAVDPDSGMIRVEYTGTDVLDRDGDEPRHRIFYNVIDNFFGDGDGNRNQKSDEVLLILLDVNDNAPEMPAPNELSWSISESLKEGVRLHPDIYAPDRDEPNTDNSRVAYEIKELVLKNRDTEVPDLFTMIQIQNVTGELETAMDLKGYWGTYDIYIQAYDHGIPQQFSDIVAYELVVRPYNFHSPVFVFPHLDIIRLAREPAVVAGILTTADGQFLDRISATDEDGLDAGLVTFTVAGDADAAQYFDVVNDGVNSGRLTLTQLFPEDIREFQLTIRGTDGGTEPAPRHTDCTVRVVFVPTQGDPVFEVNQVTVAFIEKEAGLSERFQLPRATDPKNHMCDESREECYDIYYTIIDGNSAGHFGLDRSNNIVYLVKELDRSESAVHRLVVATSNSEDSASSLPGSTITVTVNVRDADPRPVFERTLYTAGIGASDTINRVLLTVQATHSENIAIKYSIDQSSMTVDSSLETVKDSAFNLDPQTGVLSLNIQPTANMHGMFEFQVVATDTSGATDRTEVKVYLISSANRITFLFANTLDQVEPNRDFIAQVFSTEFEMTCNIDQVVPGNNNGVALANVTEVRAHFIRDHVPVPANEIEQLRSDIILLRKIQASLVINQLWLQDFVTDSSPLQEGDNNIAVYVLVALTILLGFMCLVLLLTFIIRTRALNRRLEALSMTKYGSVDSGLNRVGLAAPGTNKHAIVGSNPIWNEAVKAPDFDAISDISTDSDLIGIEDLPQFRTDYFPPEDDNSMQGIMGDTNGESVANHNNNFLFNASPFSPEFGNSAFRK